MIHLSDASFNLGTLESIFQLLLERLRNAGVDEIRFQIDYYWTIGSMDRTASFEERPDVAVGSVYDDIIELKKILSDETRLTTLDLERLGNVLIAIGEHISNSAFSVPFTGGY